MEDNVFVIPPGAKISSRSQRISRPTTPVTQVQGVASEVIPAVKVSSNSSDSQQSATTTIPAVRSNLSSQDKKTHFAGPGAVYLGLKAPHSGDKKIVVMEGNGSATSHPPTQPDPNSATPTLLAPHADTSASTATATATATTTATATATATATPANPPTTTATLSPTHTYKATHPTPTYTHTATLSPAKSKPLALVLNGAKLRVQSLLQKLLNHTRGTERLTPVAQVGVLNELANSSRELYRNKSGTGKEDWAEVVEMVCDALGESLVHEVKEIRAAALRVARMLVVDKDSAQSLCAQTFVLHSCQRSLVVPRNMEVEHTQAIKLARALLTHIPATLPLSLVSVVTACANQLNEPISGVCVETLCEIAIHDPKTVALTGGYVSVVRAVLYGDAGDDSVIASVFHVLLYLYNLPCTRRYLTDELELCLAAFTDTGYYMTLPNVAKLKRHEKSKTEEPIDQLSLLSTCGASLRTMLRTWPGMIFLFSSSRGMQSLVDNLVTGDSASKKESLRLIYTVLCSREPTWHETMEDATADLLKRMKYTSAIGSLIRKRVATGAKLMSPFMSVLLMGLFNIGLLDVLSRLICHEDSALSVQATVLLAELFTLTAQYMPNSITMQTQGMQEMVKSAATFSDHQTPNQAERSRAGAALSALIKWRLQKQRHVEAVLKRALKPQSTIIRMQQMGMQSTTQQQATRAADHFDMNLTHDGVANNGANAFVRNRMDQSNGLDHLKQDYYKMFDRLRNHAYYNCDETYLSILIRDTNVLETTVYNDWRWENSLVVLRGPLVNPKRLSDNVARDFVRTLLLHFTPSRNKFSMSRYKADSLQTTVACELVQLLLSEPDPGHKMLTDSALLHELGLALETVRTYGDSSKAAAAMLLQDQQLSSASMISDGGTNQTNQNSAMTEVQANQIARLFGRERVAKTHARDYFAILGVMAGRAEGIKLMERYHLDRGLYSILNTRSRSDLHRIMVTAMDFNRGGHARVILQRLLSHEDVSLREMSTQSLAEWVRHSPEDFATWGISMLCEQVYDIDAKVRDAAMAVLLDAAAHMSCLTELIAQRPPLRHMGEKADPLYLRFLGQTQGVYFLASSGYLEDRLLLWEELQCVTYVRNLESELRAHVVYEATDDSERQHNETARLMRITPNLDLHLYGALVQTEVGCRVVQEAMIVQTLLETLAAVNTPNEINNTNITEIKAAIWSLGHIGSSDYGMDLLISIDHAIVGRLLHLCEQGPVLSLRGTAIGAMGLIALSEKGAAQLTAHKWEVARDLTTGELRGIAIPSDCTRMFHIAPIDFEGSYPEHMKTLQQTPTPLWAQPSILNLPTDLLIESDDEVNSGPKTSSSATNGYTYAHRQKQLQRHKQKQKQAQSRARSHQLLNVHSTLSQSAAHTLGALTPATTHRTLHTPAHSTTQKTLHPPASTLGANSLATTQNPPHTPHTTQLAESLPSTFATLPVLTPADTVAREVYMWAMKINQPVLSAKARANLMRLRRADETVFRRRDVYETVMRAADDYQFSVPSRRVLHSLFPLHDIYFPESSYDDTPQGISFAQRKQSKSASALECEKVDDMSSPSTTSNNPHPRNAKSVEALTANLRSTSKSSTLDEQSAASKSSDIHTSGAPDGRIDTGASDNEQSDTGNHGNRQVPSFAGLDMSKISTRSHRARAATPVAIETPQKGAGGLSLIPQDTDTHKRALSNHSTNTNAGVGSGTNMDIASLSGFSDADQSSGLSLVGLDVSKVGTRSPRRRAPPANQNSEVPVTKGNGVSINTISVAKSDPGELNATGDGEVRERDGSRSPPQRAQSDASIPVPTSAIHQSESIVGSRASQRRLPTSNLARRESIQHQEALNATGGVNTDTPTATQTEVSAGDATLTGLMGVPIPIPTDTSKVAPRTPRRRVLPPSTTTGHAHSDSTLYEPSTTTQTPPNESHSHARADAGAQTHMLKTRSNVPVIEGGSDDDGCEFGVSYSLPIPQDTSKVASRTPRRARPMMLVNKNVGTEDLVRVQDTTVAMATIAKGGDDTDVVEGNAGSTAGTTDPKTKGDSRDNIDSLTNLTYNKDIHMESIPG